MLTPDMERIVDREVRVAERARLPLSHHKLDYYAVEGPEVLRPYPVRKEAEHATNT